ncbi:premnaspirodiene oxygenase-like isoform X2 [Ricinus communis]|uniref:premnaspirodiene oxygenase-like isoform X2 n=1 Tax=Ricinus communis TaxID=3988 RepID=UPI00201ABD59|nr:premnaspirodiene oxygenase-like isoform X2 [Ricinus communis]
MEHLHQFPFFPAFFCFLLFIFVIQSKRTKSEVSNSSSKLPPGPRKLPIIGNMLQLIGSLLHHRLRDLATQYGPVMHLQLGEVSNFVISSPEAAREVMKTHDISFAQRPFVLAASIVMYNFKDIVFAPYGDQWRQLRKICILELLSLKRVQSFRSVREEEVLFLVNSISSNAGSPINLEGFSVADTFPSFKFLHGLTGIRRKLERLHQEADTILENIIKEHRDNKASGRSDMKSEAVDLVDVLLNLHDHGNLEFPFTTDNIKAVMLDLFIAGTESSSGIIEWAMAEMIKNSRVLGKAQEEVRQIFNKKQCIIDETGLQELKYLKLVIKETLRLHPPAPLLLPRECREKVEVCGYEIPVNAKVIVNAWAIGRDPRYWNEAEKFFPERFLDNSIDYKGNDFEFIPFGAGRRMCPGISYGMAVIELSLANLLYHFDWKLPDGMEPKDFDMSESFGVTARKKNELFLIPIPYQP